MSRIDFKTVTKQYSPVLPLTINNATLTIDRGDFCVFVGPSGCGKSTLLRMVAGLESITSGDIEISGKRVNDLPPAKRGVAMVFQSYALYPHMTVAENMAFGLRVLGSNKTEIDTKVKKAADILQLTPLLERLPKQLSGGQRQRVAIGRAIVKEPDVFLFDEPLSNLDAALRVQTRLEIAKLHHDIGRSSMIYVTHDQVEAMTLADRIVILNHGRIEQIGTPEEVYDTPATVFVAGFIGAPPMNLLPAEALPDHSTRHGVLVGVRPEHLLWHKGAGAPFLSGKATVVEPLGSDTLVSLDVAGSAVIARLAPRLVRKAGEEVALSADPANIHFFDRATGARL